MQADSYLNLRLEQFLDAITDKKIVYQFTTFGAFSNIKGTLPELYSFASQGDIETRRKLEQLLVDKKEYKVDFELSDIEIFNYLEKITSNFDEVKTKIVLHDIEVYYSMDFMERIMAESSRIYKENEWEIPLITVVAPLFDKEKYEVPDFEKMLKKTHPVSGFTISNVISLLKQKLKHTHKSKTEKETDNTETNILNDFPEIFKPGGYKLFCLLNEKYTKDNKAKKTKFSNIYHFLEYNNNLNCSQLEYIAFIKSEYQITLSKIYPKTLKYEDTIQSLLQRYSVGQI